MKSIPFFAIHAIAIVGVIAGGWSWKGFALAITLYVIRMFGVTGAYHRYFSHRTYRTSRVMQFLLALLATSSAQKGVLWWAAHHRHHHKTSDQEGDVHSLKRDGFWWSHVGWILSEKYDHTDDKHVKDLSRFPELRWLDKWHLVPPTALGVGLFFLGGGWNALLWGLFVSTVLLWHGTFTINSLTHLWGNRRYVTTDNSRNNFWLAMITLGEGWHNNHHYYPASTRQGFFWWEIDITFYVLKVMSWLGLIWDLQSPPEKIRDAYVRGPESGRAPVAAPRPIGRRLPMPVVSVGEPDPAE
jgi:stearoyl-CoA desaturase (Delta-9 desaturase)